MTYFFNFGDLVFRRLARGKNAIEMFVQHFGQRQGTGKMAHANGGAAVGAEYDGAFSH
jgi:hypothetical protein